MGRRSRPAAFDFSESWAETLAFELGERGDFCGDATSIKKELGTAQYICQNGP